MKVAVISFSFKRGIPDDPTGNGNAPVAEGDQVGRMSEANEPRSGRKSLRECSIAEPCPTHSGTRHCATSPSATSSVRFGHHGTARGSKHDFKDAKRRFNHLKP